MLRTYVQQLCKDVGDTKFSGVDGDKCPLEEGVLVLQTLINSFTLPRGIMLVIYEASSFLFGRIRRSKSRRPKIASEVKCRTAGTTKRNQTCIQCAVPSSFIKFLYLTALVHVRMLATGPFFLFR